MEFPALEDLGELSIMTLGGQEEREPTFDLHKPKILPIFQIYGLKDG